MSFPGAKAGAQTSVARPPPLLSLTLAFAFATLLTSCANPAGPDGSGRSTAPQSVTPVTTPAAAAAAPAGSSAAPSAAAAAPSAAAAAPATGAGADAGADAGETALLVDAGADAAAEAAEAAQPFVKDNKILPPLESEELTARARGLFEAIVKDEPALGEAFWFPKEPFIPLKDVKEAGKYWDTLHATYVSDIRALHRKRKSWEGAKFAGFQIGSAPKWVPPGDEGNKIGYYRTFRGKLRYEIDGEASSIEVRVIISWQGRWFITHLRPFKKSE